MAQTATVQIQMPEMGESVTEGIVLEWHVAEGDFVREGDAVVEVSTDKVDAEVPAPADGTITKLIAAVDDEVPVGAPLAEMEAGGEPDEGQSAGPAGPVAAGDPPPLPVAEASSGGVPPTAPPAGESSEDDESSAAGLPSCSVAGNSSQASSLRRFAMRSAARRLLTKTMVEVCSWTSFRSSG